MWSHLIDNRLLTLHGVLVFIGLAVYVIGSRTRHQRRHPSAAIAWVVSLGLMPYVALPLYLLFGSRKVERAVHVASADTDDGPQVAGARSGVMTPFQQLAAAMELPDVATCHGLSIHADGAQALLALRVVMYEAQHTLDVCTFLVGHDVLGRELLDTLIRRARDGVRVRLLVDGIGIYLGGRIDIRRLRAAGVQVALFVSPFRSGLPGRTNLRNHRKLVVADGCRTWTGGRNLAAEYFCGDPSRARRRTPWVDLTFDFSGAIARQTQQRFDLDWAFATGTAVSDTPATGALAQVEGSSPTQLIASGPDQNDDTFYTLLVASCFAARSRILAVTPYFVPDAVLMMALTLAARRQCQVDLVLPRHSNHRLADHARHAALRELTAAGGRVWLVPDMMHAKAVVVDADLCLVGSANLDERSLFLNYELMVAFFDRGEVGRFAHWIERHRARAERYRGERPGVMREIGEGLVRWLAFQL
ncbi:MAG: phospholipase D-like domain-containing protein [Burkholderiaceae bacterium]